MAFGLTVIFFVYLCGQVAVDVNGERLRIDGRVYEHQQPMELGVTNCYTPDSSQCQMLQQSVCNTLLELLPSDIRRAASCANFEVKKDDNKYITLGLDIQFQNDDENMRGINVTCATFISLYFMEIRRSHQTGKKTVGDPVYIYPDSYEFDWDGNTVDFSVRGTLLVNGSRVPIANRNSLDTRVVETGLYKMPGIHTMIKPIFSRGQVSLSNTNMFNSNGFIGVSFILTYEKEITRSYNLDPSCSTFSMLLQQAFRNPTARGGYQVDRDAVVNLMTPLVPKSESNANERERPDPEQTYPERTHDEQERSSGEQTYAERTFEEQERSSKKQPYAEREPYLPESPAVGSMDPDASANERDVVTPDDGNTGDSGSYLCYCASLLILSLLTVKFGFYP